MKPAFSFSASLALSALLFAPASAQAWFLRDEYAVQTSTGIPAMPVRVPEGVAFDPVQAEFYATGVFGGRITRIPAIGGGAEKTFYQEPAGNPYVAFLGVEIDPLRRVAWVCASDPLSNPAAPTGSVYAIRMNPGSGPGTLLKKFPLPTPFFCNDVAVDYAGNAYVTNSAGDTVYRVKHSALNGAGGAQPFATHPAFAPVPGGLGLNGIALTPDGRYLITVTSIPAGIFRISLADPADVRPVQLVGDAFGQNPDPAGDPIRFLAPDGLAFAFGRLYVSYHGAVQRLTFANASWLKAKVASTIDVPTGLSTAAEAYGNVYVIKSETVPVTQPQLGLPLELPHKIVRVKPNSF